MLLGLMVELRGFTPRFLGIDETLEDAFASDTFAAVVIDCDHSLWGERFFSACRDASARPILFSPFRIHSEVRDLANRYGARSFTLPTDTDTFGKLLEA